MSASRVVRIVALASAGLVWPGTLVAQSPPLSDPIYDASTEGSFAYQPSDDLMHLSLEALLRMPVTSATGGLELESDVVPANVITISREDIVAHGWQSVAEVLEHVPGLYVIDDHVLPGISVRGISGGLRSGSRIVKVMINGIEVSFRPDLTAMLGPEYIPMVAVQQIEIARGPLSALYGANAFLATVNIVTRDASPLEHGEVALRGGLGTDLDAQAPSRGSGGVSALFSTTRGPFEVLLAAHLDRIDRSGLRLDQTFANQATTMPIASLLGQKSDVDLARPISLFGQASASTRAGKFSLQGGWQRLDSAGEFQAESVLTHRSRVGLSNLWSQAKHELTILPALTSSLAVGYSQGAPIAQERRYLNDNENAHYRTELDYRAYDFKATLLFSGIDKVQALLSLDGTHERHHGFNYRQIFVAAQGPRQPGDEVDTRAPIDVAQSNLAPSLQLLVSPIPDLHLIANGRLDLSNVFQPQVSWRAGASYRFHRALVGKLITGRAFQSPSPVLLYGLREFGVANNIVGSESPGGEPVEPQIVQSAEAVLSALLGTHASIVASVFWQQVDQKIEFLSNALGYRARNRRRETDLGAELTVRGSLGRFSPHLSATSHRVLSTNELKSAIGDAPAQYPTFWAVAGLRVGVPELRLRVDATTRVAGPRGATQGNAFRNGKPYTVPGYTITDLVVTSEDLPLWDHRRPSRLTLAIRNLLHQSRFEPGFGDIDLPGHGRRVMLELHQSF